ncbi:MAG: hypothetical protein M1814_004686 [Vezdaea aestivalis]|nr:MAG: hypothetical protein M1814_004686 [Vezdaea aestivalis]
MIDRYQRRSPSLNPSSRETSPTPSGLLSDCDADDESTMSSGENSAPSRPLSVAIPKPTNQYDGRYIARRPALADILANTAPSPWTLSAFMAYLSQNHCLETLEFTMDASRYRKHFSQTIAPSGPDGLAPPSEEKTQFVRMLWQRLLEAYIIPNGPREVNLPSTVRDALLSQSNISSPPHPSTLDEAVKIIYELMEESVLVPFLNSVSFNRAPNSATISGYNTSEEALWAASLEERRFQHGMQSSLRRDASPPQSILEFPQTAARIASPQSNLSASLARATASSGTRLAPIASNSSDTAALTDDSGGASSPGREPMTPPSTPPTSDLGSSPKASWKKMTGKLGWKKGGRSGSNGGIKTGMPSASALLPVPAQTQSRPPSLGDVEDPQL